MRDGKYTALLPRSGKLVYGSDFHYGTDLVFSTHASPVIQKDSPMKVMEDIYILRITHLTCVISKEMFDHNLSWIRDTGLIQKMEADAVRDARAKNVKLSKIAGDRPLTLWKYSMMNLSHIKSLLKKQFLPQPITRICNVVCRFPPLGHGLHV